MSEDCSKKKCCDEKKDPKECSEEQVEKCHGDAKEHPCEKEEEEKDKDKL